MRKNWLTTVGGIMALFAGVPIAIGTYANTAHVAINLPSWFYVMCISLGVLGPGIGLIAAKGQDEHSTPDQVIEAGEKANGGAVTGNNQAQKVDAEKKP